VPGSFLAVAVRGNVVSCDLCGQQIGLPTAMKHAGRHDVDESVRAYAVGWGWRHTDQGDLCPEHQEEVAADPQGGRRQRRHNVSVAPMRRALGVAGRLSGPATP
jgi:hypothetical protein